MTLDYFPLVFRKVSLSPVFFFPVVRLAASPNTYRVLYVCRHILRDHMLAFSFEVGWISLAADSREQAERTEGSLEDEGHGSGLVASRTNAPAVNNRPPLLFFCLPSTQQMSLCHCHVLKLSRYKWFCVATESPMGQSNLFTAQNWCAQRRGLWLDHTLAWELGGAGGGTQGNAEEEQEPERVVKYQGYLVLPRELKEGHMNVCLYLVFWLSQAEAAPCCSARPYISLWKIKKCRMQWSILYIWFILWKQCYQTILSLQSLPI